MKRINVCDIDKMLNTNTVPLDIALKKIENHIVQEIDPTFPVEEFEAWVDSDTDRPFRWNRKLYLWSN